jgi:hypothetical protein
VSLLGVLDAVVARISAAVGAGVRVGTSVPHGADELPALTLSIDGVTERLTGIGAIPRGAQTGALPVVVETDLSHPVTNYGDGTVFSLLSDDRRTFTLPNGPLVRADGVAERPFTGEDLRADDGTAYAVVDTDPVGRQVRPVPEEGTLLFGTSLPATGTLTVTHFVGQWDVTISRYQGELGVVVTAATGTEIDVLSRQVSDALAADHPLGRFRPSSLGATRSRPIGELTAGERTLGYLLDVELEEPVLPSGGGAISTIAVRSDIDGTAETFTVARQGGPA